ncbi:MAG: 3-isopropylmalate dehydratase large subunit [Candidatus Gracilibacteria bacterium]|nr:3-isopropylmalate dehydratase large subunit [Candidatus Gracilibacteria bacterium]
MPKNIIEKIWESHVVIQKNGHPAVFGIDLQLTHEVTSPQGFEKLRQRGQQVKQTHRMICTLDHSIPTRKNRLEIYDENAKNQVEQLRTNAKEFGIPIFDFDSGHQGIVHVIGPELGLTQPGMTIVCGDSHTSTHGAFGALAFGVGSTEVGLVMETGCILQKPLKTLKVEFNGIPQAGVYSKDYILALITQIGIAGGNGHIIEFCGEAIRALSMEERMTICNMSIECGARAGVISPDQTTFEYIKDRKYAPKTEDWEKAIQEWKQITSDKDCSYDKEISIDISTLMPQITWGTNPEQGIGVSESIPTISSLPSSHQSTAKKALAYTKLQEGKKIEGTPLDYAFLGSCTNSRIEDLRIAAKILKDKVISKNITMLVVPGSEAVKAQAESEGLDKIFLDAGCEWRMPGCSMCLGMNDDKVPSGKRCISTSNRNFVGRQGTGSITHLASPATVAVSAIKGVISDPRKHTS